MARVSTKLSRVALDANRTIESGEPIRVDAIVVANGSGGDVVVTVTNNASSPVSILTIAVKAGDTETINCPFIAHQGLIINSASSASVLATVFHSAQGA